MTLPGWGAWVGKGVRKAKAPSKPKFVKHLKGVLPTDRKDAGLNHVIINEKRDRKSVKYLTSDLPFPFTSVAQYEHSLRKPLGSEWTTATVHRNNTTPSVLVKPGALIEPISRDQLVV